ncbi:MAG: hypothetical protein ACFFDB_00440 [Promethearchaeota archaeon]
MKEAKLIAVIDKINIYCELKSTDKIIELEYKDLLKDIKERISALKENITGQSKSLSKFISPIQPVISISKEEYLQMIKIKHSVMNHRSVSDQVYLSYLLQIPNIEKLKQICRDREIKGFSNLNKPKLIEFIIDNLSEEDYREYLIENEQELISSEIAAALKIINKRDTEEKIKQVRIINPDNHEIEITFEKFDWEVKTSLTINPDNIDDPERSCDCRVGSNAGFCYHFWICFIKSLKLGYLSESRWNLTYLPEDFIEFYKDVNL